MMITKESILEIIPHILFLVGVIIGMIIAIGGIFGNDYTSFYINAVFLMVLGIGMKVMTQQNSRRVI